MKKADFLLIFAIILISISAFFVIHSLKPQSDSVIISKNGKIIYELPLYENTEIDLKGNIILVENGNVYMKSADCPDKLCIKTGKISDSGRSIICLPNKIEIRVTKKSEVDTVVK